LSFFTSRLRQSHLIVKVELGTSTGLLVVNLFYLFLNPKQAVLDFIKAIYLHLVKYVTALVK
jgi:hypothetical protein